MYILICLHIQIYICINTDVNSFMLAKKVMSLQTWIFFCAMGCGHCFNQHLNLNERFTSSTVSTFSTTQPASRSILGWPGAMSAIWLPFCGPCVTSQWCQTCFLQTDAHLPLTFMAGISHQPQRTGQSLNCHED